MYVHVQWPHYILRQPLGAQRNWWAEQLLLWLRFQPRCLCLTQHTQQPNYKPFCSAYLPPTFPLRQLPSSSLPPSTTETQVHKGEPTNTHIHCIHCTSPSCTEATPQETIHLKPTTLKVAHTGAQNCKWHQPNAHLPTQHSQLCSQLPPILPLPRVLDGREERPPCDRGAGVTTVPDHEGLQEGRLQVAWVVALGQRHLVIGDSEEGYEGLPTPNGFWLCYPLEVNLWWLRKGPV